MIKLLKEGDNTYRVLNKVFIAYGTDSYNQDKFKEVDLNNYKSTYLNKPIDGLWASPVNSKWGWKDWCESENWNTESLNKHFMFTLSPNSKIYVINTLRDLTKISTIKNQYGTLIIDFKKLIANNYDGIYVTLNAVSKLRYAGAKIEGLSSWDCESICVFNKNIIQPYFKQNKMKKNKVIKESPEEWNYFIDAMTDKAINILLNSGYNQDEIDNVFNNNHIELDVINGEYSIYSNNEIIYSKNGSTSTAEFINDGTDAIMDWIISKIGREIKPIDMTVFSEAKNKHINESKENIVNIKIDFNGYYSDKRKKFDGGLYSILLYLKENKLNNTIIRLDVDKKNDTTWKEVDLYCPELSIKTLDYSINDVKYPKYTANITCNPKSAKTLIKLLVEMAKLGNGGHSYGILINDKHFNFDGDGSDHISSINDIELTSKIYNNVNKIIDMYNQGLQNNETIKLTESELKKIIKNTVKHIVNEASNSQLKKKIINQLYKHTQSLTSHLYKDDNWEAVSKAFKTIEYIIGDAGELEVRVENGGYWKQIYEFPNYKEYKFTIHMNNGIEINGSLKCHAAGTMEDTFSKYDMTITFW